MIEPLLRAVVDQPEDVAARRVYADALLERGDPRGEFIQVQCDLATIDPDDPRALTLDLRMLELLHAHQARWKEPYGNQLKMWFSRGMIADVEGYVPALLDAPALLEREPVVQLAFEELPPAELAALAQLTALQRIRRLRLRHCTLDPAALTTLLGRDTLALRELSLWHCGPDDAGLAAATALPFWRRLERLELDLDDLSPTAVGALVADPGLERVHSMAWRALKPETLQVAIDRFALPGLSSLQLHGSGLGDPQLDALIARPWIHQLKQLNLASNQLARVESLRALRSIEDLDLSHNKLNKHGTFSVAMLPPSLRRLRLDKAHLGFDGIRRISRGVFPVLASLCLQSCALGDEAIEQLAGVPWPLRELDLTSNRFGRSSASALAAARFAPSLRQLNLTATKLDDDGLTALVAGELPELRRLDLSRNELGDRGVAALVSATGLPKLTRVTMFRSTLSPTALAALERRFGAGLML